MLFNVWHVTIFPICEKVLTVSNLDIAYIARSMPHMGNPNFEAEKCIGYISLIVLGTSLNYITSRNVTLVTLSYKDITATSVSGETIVTLLK